jgi:hypothetical protein
LNNVHRVAEEGSILKHWRNTLKYVKRFLMKKENLSKYKLLIRKPKNFQKRVISTNNKRNKEKKKRSQSGRKIASF